MKSRRHRTYGDTRATHRPYDTLPGIGTNRVDWHGSEDRLSADMKSGDAKYIWASFRRIVNNAGATHRVKQQTIKDERFYSNIKPPPHLVFRTYDEWLHRFPYAKELPMGWNYWKELQKRNPDRSRLTTNPLSANYMSPLNGGSRGSQKKRNLRKYKSIKKSKKAFI